MICFTNLNYIHISHRTSQSNTNQLSGKFAVVWCEIVIQHWFQGFILPPAGGACKLHTLRNHPDQHGPTGPVLIIAPPPLRLIAG